MARSNIKAVFANDVQTVWNIVTDVKNYIWRTDLSKTEIISDKQFIEYTKNGYATTCWVSVKQFSKNDTATACQDWLRSTRLGRGSIKSHVRTVKVLGMGLFAFQERIHLWKGVTH